jgi:2-alkyl-3-oxoalkanoate reductase
MPPETVLVVGASGLVGDAAVRALDANGHSVRALLRRPTEAARFAGTHVTPIVGDLLATLDWRATLEGVTSVVDSTQVRVPGRLTKRRARGAAELRRAMTTNVLAQVHAHAPGLRSYVALSGLEDYEATGDAWFDESTPPAASPLGYSWLSVHSRARLAEAQREWGLPLVMLRMGLIYGTSGWFTAFADRIRAGRGTLVGPGTNFASLVAAVDVGAAIRASVERAPRNEEFLIVDDEPQRQAAWQAVLAATLGRPPIRRRTPVWLAALAVGAVNAETFASSRRARNGRAKERLGLQLTYPTVRDGFPAVLGAAPAPSP